MLGTATVPEGFRDRFLRAIVLIGVAGFAITELLSAFGAIRRVPLLLCWMVVAVAGVVYLGRSMKIRIPKLALDPVVAVSVAGTVLILALTAITAAASPPNSWDALAYHMPRVVYWAEQASVRFFPTPYLNQIMLQPLAEYFTLHSYVLTGGDRFVNFVQWFGSVGSIVGVSSVARVLGAGARGQAIAALFCATLPSGILASSSAKNDYFLAMWLVAAIYFGARFVRSLDARDALFLGAALGLAMLTKATVYLFAPWLLAAVVLPRARSLSPRILGMAAAALIVALLLNVPHYARNVQLNGSPLGFDSPHGDGFFRWRNESFGWKQTASNILRNTSEQLGGRSEQRNREVYDWVVRAHERLGIDVNDPATTWRWTTFEPPRNTNHEADANSKWHILILWIASGIVAWRALRTRDIGPVLYPLALGCGFVAFCAYLKWQPYETRLFLPLLVAGAPMVGAALDRSLRPMVQVLLCVFLLSTARRPALENWLRPLEGPRSVLHVPRDDQYFSDMQSLSNVQAYRRTVQLLTPEGCQRIGIDSTDLALEYPLMALLREQKPQSLFVHTGVQNASSRYAPPVDGAPCAVVCLDCAPDAKRLSLYHAYPVLTGLEKFVVFHTNISSPK
jgi:4-amino-4-deoxy-L-arabinose transferase-like glycosyltransferase